MGDRKNSLQIQLQDRHFYPNLLVFVMERSMSISGPPPSSNRNNLGASVIVTWEHAETASLPFSSHTKKL